MADANVPPITLGTAIFSVLAKMTRTEEHQHLRVVGPASRNRNPDGRNMIRLRVILQRCRYHPEKWQNEEKAEQQNDCVRSVRPIPDRNLARRFERIDSLLMVRNR